jgi:ADP-ribose pyrophosphatase YjhB (NUDIX family)
MIHKRTLYNCFGGIIINKSKEVLLVKPANCFGNYEYTFPKGRALSWELPIETAIREVFEESGVVVNKREIYVLDGEYLGESSINRYYLMKPEKLTNEFDWETESIHWCSYDKAKELLSKSISKIGRLRDLRVLDVAFNFHNEVRKTA